MTITEALNLAIGDSVCHAAKLDYTHKGMPVKAPMRITKIWVNAKRTIVLLRIASVDSTAWLDATGYELPPDGLTYDKWDREWVSPAELKRRKAERAGRAKAAQPETAKTCP